ncbi:hypothetical protein SALBM135S_02354 [Streptomyces alboniger]
MPGSLSAVRTRSRTPPVSGGYASGTGSPVQSATRRRLRPLVLRSSSTVSGSTAAPITSSVTTAVKRMSAVKRYERTASPAALPSCAMARPAARTVSFMRSG